MKKSMWVTQTSEILMWQLLQDLQIMFHRCWYVFIYFSSIYILGFEGQFFSVIFYFHLQFTQRAARKIKNCLHYSLSHYSKTSCEAALALRRDGRRASNSYVRSSPSARASSSAGVVPIISTNIHNRYETDSGIVEEFYEVDDARLDS